MKLFAINKTILHDTKNHSVKYDFKFEDAIHSNELISIIKGDHCFIINYTPLMSITINNIYDNTIYYEAKAIFKNNELKLTTFNLENPTHLMIYNALKDKLNIIIPTIQNAEYEFDNFKEPTITPIDILPVYMSNTEFKLIKSDFDILNTIILPNANVYHDTYEIYNERYGTLKLFIELKRNKIRSQMKIVLSNYYNSGLNKQDIFAIFGHCIILKNSNLNDIKLLSGTNITMFNSDEFKPLLNDISSRLNIYIPTIDNVGFDYSEYQPSFDTDIKRPDKRIKELINVKIY